MRMKVMKSQTMMISVQCQAQFSNEILRKYGWSFSQGNHVRLQHKEDVVHAKQQTAIAVPAVSIQQIIQPLYIKLAVQHLSFSQLAVYKQQLLRETNESIIRLQTSAGSSSSSGTQHMQTTRIVDALAMTEANVAPMSSSIEPAQAMHVRQEKQRDTTWLHMKQVSQHFKQDRFLQSIIEKRNAVVHYYERVKHMEHVMTNAQTVAIENDGSLASPNREQLVSEQPTASTVRGLEKKEQDVQQAELTKSQLVTTSYAKQPARMIWHERVEERQQQWRKEHESLLLKTQTVVKQLENESIFHNVVSEKRAITPANQASRDERITGQDVQWTIHRLVHDDFVRYRSTQHLKVSTKQLTQLRKISMKDVSEKTLSKIEQRLSQEHIKLYYVAEQKRQQSRPKKENSQLVQDRQAVAHHIHQIRRNASVLKVVKAQAHSSSLQATHVQSAAQTISVTLSSQQMVHSTFNRMEGSRTQVEKQLVKFPVLKELSVSEQWLNRIKFKKQLSLIHLTKQVSEITRKSDDEKSPRPNSEQSSSEKSDSPRLNSEQSSREKNDSPRLNSEQSSREKNDSPRSNSEQSSREKNDSPRPNSEQSSSEKSIRSRSTLREQSSSEPLSNMEAPVSDIALEGSSQHNERSNSSSTSAARDIQQPQQERLQLAEAKWIVNHQLQAKVEHVHLHSLQHSITKQIKSVLAPAIQGALRSRSNDKGEPLLQAKWQHKLASPQTVLLNKLQERLNVIRHTDDVITVHNQHSVTIHAQSSQLVTLKSGKAISLSHLSHRGEAAIQKLTSRALARRELTYREIQEAQAIPTIPILARKLLREVKTQTINTHSINKQTINTHLIDTQTIRKQDAETRNEQAVYNAEHSSVTQQSKELVHERVFRPIIKQHMTILYKEHEKLPTALKRGVQQANRGSYERSSSSSVAINQVERTKSTMPVEMKQVEHARSMPVEMKQVERSRTLPVEMKQVERSRTLPVKMRQVEYASSSPVAINQVERTKSTPVAMKQDRSRSLPVSVRQAEQFRILPVHMRMAEHSNALPVVIHHTDMTRSNSKVDTRLSYVDSSKPSRVEAAQKEDNAQTLSLKRVELDTVIKHVSLLVKEEKKVKQQDSLTEPIAVMQTHIKKLEEQITQQQQLIQDARNPNAIKQLSNQIYEELSRKIKFDNQRLGR
ncbi:hypothetical protein ACFP56_17490 [Paenibacillus septentrionalis]|uniref:Uncharacterized protein n=1 Tax=Paenibacillus septentrionalis TaxID=429342 RepID=A0ABW1V6L2_9BACL